MVNFSGTVFITVNQINGKVYVGQTINQNPYYKGSGCALSKAIKKYGKENFLRTNLKTNINSQKLLDFWESFYIKLFNARDREIGYNIKEGGSRGGHSEETKKVIREKRSKQIITEEHKYKVSLSLKGRKSPTTGRKATDKEKLLHSLHLINNYKNKTGIFDPVVQKNRIEKMKEVYRSPEMRKKFREIRRKLHYRPVICYTVDNELIGEFNTQSDAAEALGLKTPSGISSVLTGAQKTHKGYIFKYKE